MRWTESSALSISLISIVVGGYALTANHNVGPGPEDELREVLQQFSELKEDVLKHRSANDSRLPNQPLVSRNEAPKMKESDFRLLRQEINNIQDQQNRLERAFNSFLNADNVEGVTPGDIELVEGEVDAIAMVEATELESSFDVESFDPSWGPSAESEIHASFAERLPEGISFMNTECRTSACRIEVEFDDDRSKREGMPFLPMVIPWPGESVIQKDPKGKENSAVIYVAREGFPLYSEAPNAPE